MSIARWIIDGRFGIKYEFDLEVEILQGLQDKRDEVVKYEAQVKSGDEIEPPVVPGSSQWEIFARPI